ncbi:hypothetical protein ACFRNT_47000 [Streptomyces sp. NPDC056697]|uniref:hypothetical protein n=1 Tax=Streptomyces sp. NPDC056697 TaxID=3345915 RepID=UPI0036BDBBDD
MSRSWPRPATLLGWTRTLVLGVLLLGLPAPLQALSDHLLPILLTTALRGAGFGIITVCGSTATAALAPRGRQGAAIGSTASRSRSPKSPSPRRRPGW